MTTANGTGIRSTRSLAMLAMIVAVVGWAASSLFVRAGQSDALVFTTWRLWFAVPPLGLIAFVRSRGERAVPLVPPGVSAGRWALVMIVAGASFIGAAATSFAALGLTRLLDVTLIIALEPVLIIAFAVAFLNEHVNRGQYVRTAVAIGATMVVAISGSRGGSWSLEGDLIAVVSLVLNAVWFLYARVLRMRYVVDPVVFMFWTLLCASVINVPLTLLVHGSLSISGRGMFFAACTAVSGTTGHALMVYAHRYLPTATSSPFVLAEPPLVAVGGWIFFDEALSPIEIVGSLVVIGSLWGVVRSSALEHAEGPEGDPVGQT
jgi:drug/metabolite transporter (DMT)-like permease